MPGVAHSQARGGGWLLMNMPDAGILARLVADPIFWVSIAIVAIGLLVSLKPRR